MITSAKREFSHLRNALEHQSLGVVQRFLERGRMDAMLGRAGEHLANGVLHQIEGLVVAELGGRGAVIPMALDNC